MKQQELSERLKRWGYREEANERVKPILELCEQGKLKAFEKALSDLSFRLLQDFKDGSITGKEVDDLFMIIDLYVSEKELRDHLTEETQRLLFEGLLFHDAGGPHGPDIEFMHQLIQKLRREEVNP